MFVAVGEGGIIITSADQNVWNIVKSGTAEELTGITVNSSNMFVAVGNKGTIITSLDGITWSEVNSNTIQDLKRQGFNKEEIEDFDIEIPKGAFVINI